MSSSSTDSLLGLRSRFQIGDFTGVVEAITKGKFGEECKEELETILFRSMISLGNSQDVLKSLNPSTDSIPHLLAMRLLAEYYKPSATPASCQAVIEQLSKAEAVAKYAQSIYFRIAQASILIADEKYEQALQALAHTPTETLEMFSYLLSLFVMILHPPFSF
jgi:hypothetical protein